MSAALWMSAAFFAFVMASITMAGNWFLRRMALADQTGPRIPAGLTINAADLPPTQAFALRAFRLMGTVMPAKPAKTELIRRRLISAGYHWPSAVETFVGIKIATGLLVAVLLGWAIAVSRESLTGALVLGMGGAVFGSTLPEFVLDRIIRQRSRALRRALPTALDLIVLAIEAGQTLNQAILDATLALKHAFPELSTELAIVHLQLRAGKSRTEALQGLAARNPKQPEMRKLAALLIQSDRFGSSLGPTLQSHARYVRARIRQQAQEAARKIGVKLVFPIFFLIFPSLLLVTLGPAVLQLFTSLLPMLNSAGP